MNAPPNQVVKSRNRKFAVRLAPRRALMKEQLHRMCRQRKPVQQQHVATSEQHCNKNGHDQQDHHYNYRKPQCAFRFGLAFNIAAIDRRHPDTLVPHSLPASLREPAIRRFSQWQQGAAVTPPAAGTRPRCAPRSARPNRRRAWLRAAAGIPRAMRRSPAPGRRCYVRSWGPHRTR